MRRVRAIIRVMAAGRSLRAPALAWCVCVTTLLLACLGYRATSQSQQRARQLLERRAAEQFALLWAGLSQDMRGAQEAVLSTVTRRQLTTEPPYDLAEVFARGFARFPYPESFFAWRRAADGREVTYTFTRAHQPPPWLARQAVAGPYPVAVVRNSAGLRDLMAQARLKARANRPAAAFETRLAGTPYQVVVRFLYDGDDSREDGDKLAGLVGFLVNLDWVRRAYFHELSAQISRIGGDPADVSLSVVDDGGAVITETRLARRDIPTFSRTFPLWFANQALLRHVSRDERVRYWTASAAAAQDSRLAATTLETSATVVLLSLAAAAGVIGLLVTARGARAASELAVMKADFVSSVTHELKTPLAVIQLIGDTLCQGRYDSPETVRHYAQLLSHESRNFTRLIDNLLTYARLSDRSDAYLFVPIQVGELIEDAVERFQMLLYERQFTVTVTVPEDLPAVRADRSALLQVLDNLIDNAVKYSDARRVLTVDARPEADRVIVTVSDAGIGIPHDEIERVCEKFFRGRGVRVGGGGLGLAITRRIIEAHRGSLRIDSAPDVGTRVHVGLRVASGHGETHSHRRG
ncbi:MAG: sensor histidine kinase [Vicinamibacterales bacterium]